MKEGQQENSCHAKSRHGPPFDENSGHRPLIMCDGMSLVGAPSLEDDATGSLWFRPCLALTVAAVDIMFTRSGQKRGPLRSPLQTSHRFGICCRR